MVFLTETWRPKTTCTSSSVTGQKQVMARHTRCHTGFGTRGLTVTVVKAVLCSNPPDSLHILVKDKNGSDALPSNMALNLGAGWMP